MNSSRLKSSIRIVGLYALVGGVWIIASDRILGVLVPDINLYVLFSTYKGWFYVLITSLMLFALMRVEDGNNRKLEERYRLLFEISPDPLIVTDGAGRLLEVNQRCSERYGYSRSELLRMRIEDLDTQPMTEVERNRLAGLLGAAYFERRHRKNDGSLIDVEIRTDPLEWQGQACFLSSIRDITERKQAEAVLRDSEEKFRRLVDGNIIGVMICDLDGKITQANESFLSMIGYQRDDLPLDWRNLTPKDWADLDEKAIQSLVQSGIAKPWEKEYLCKDGHRVPVLIGVSLLESGNETIAFILDLSERKATEAHIRASLAEKEILLREVHHRVKNNLQIIIALADLQSDKVSDPIERQKIEVLRQRVFAISSVHEALTSFETLSFISARGYIEQIGGNLYAALGKVGMQMDIQVEEMHISLEQAVPFGLILNELLTNAFLHAFPASIPFADRKVWIRLWRDGEWAVLEVGDNGVGLPPGVEMDGLASLGLRLVDRLVHQLQARMEVQRENGVTFRVAFRSLVEESSRI